jgi:hypothetical protein
LTLSHVDLYDEGSSQTWIRKAIMTKLVVAATLVVLLAGACDDDPKPSTDGPVTTDASTGGDARDAGTADAPTGTDAAADMAAVGDAPAGTDAAADGAPAADAAPDSGPGSEWIRICEEFHDSLCAKLDECVPLYTKLIFGDVENCAKRQALTCANAMAAPGSTVTPAQATTCIADLDDTACEQIFYRNTPASCRFMGTRDPGMACTEDSQCKTGFCKRPNDDMCGMCGTPGAADAACEEDDDCAQSLICHEDDKKCVVPAGMGMPCTEAVPCRVGLRCAGGTCMAQLNQVGADCEENEDCNNSMGLFCNDLTSKCIEVDVATSGETCGVISADEVVVCQGLAECVIVGAALQGTCSQVVPDGAACDADKLCEEPANCIEGFCKIPNPLMCN